MNNGIKIADVITLHSSGEDLIIGADEFDLMKESVILVNSARGGIVNESDLYDALTKNKIRGAGLDVFEAEPPDNSPLLEMENVVITPHTAGSTIDTWWRRLDFAFDNITRVSRGEKPLFVVDD